MGTRRRCVRWGWLLVMTAALLPATARAHDVGTTQVALVIDANRQVAATIDVDPDALLLRLQIGAGEDLALPDDPAARTAAIAARSEAFLSAVALSADGQPVPLRFQYLPARAADDVRGAASTIQLTGIVPAGARHLTWRYDLPLGSYALRIVQPGFPEVVHWLVGGRTSEPLPLRASASRSSWRVAREYLWLGVVHIVPRGLDHILFVLGLFLLRRDWRPLLAQVSVFTLAHSITLALSVTSTIEVPARLVEPLIGASIAWVAVNNLRSTALTPARLGVVFLFGLLHGLGFAGVLSELGLPAGSLAVALAAFNVGVEVGQLTVLATAAAATALVAARGGIPYRRWVTVPASVAIAIVGVYWTVSRALAG